MANWELKGCCNSEQRLFLILFGCFMVVNTVLWRTPLLKPMKLISTFVHEMGHATACWMTGGEVKAIEVYGNEGGVTKCKVKLVIISFVLLGDRIIFPLSSF